MNLPPELDAEAWALRITMRWRASVEAIIEVGQLLIDAKGRLPHGEFGAMLDNALPFGERTAQRLMAIAGDKRLSNPTHVSRLPASWGTLYELTQLSDAEFDRGVEQQVIRPDMERRDVEIIRPSAPSETAEESRSKARQADKKEHRATRERDLAAKQTALPDKRYGVIYADPEWRFEVFSRETGMDRAADNHYPTSTTDEICARPVGDIAADDCVLFLWATVPMLPDALKVMAAWLFNYKSHVIWNKDRIGTGYWFRNRHELLLVGTRGHIPAPAMGTQFPSVVDAPVGKHSEKPDAFYDLIEAYFPTLPKIELNARRARDGWDRWGLEANAGAEA